MSGVESSIEAPSGAIAREQGLSRTGLGGRASRSALAFFRPGALAHARERELSLDVIRGIAILLAIGWHLNKPTQNIVAQLLLWPSTRFGWAGVDLFFVLSGFLIGGITLREVQRTGGFNRNRFFIRRAMRLWPVLYIFVLGQIALDRFPLTAFVPQILLHVQNYFPTPISHLWSLAIEEQFYLLAGIFLPLIARRGASPRAIVTGLIAIVLGSAALRTIGSFIGVAPLALQFQTQFRADELALGVLLAATKLYYPDRFAALKRLWPLWIAVILAGCFILSEVVWTDVEHLRPLLGFPTALCASGALLLLLHERRVVGPLRPLAKGVAWLGVYSYSIYIWHPGIGRIGGPKIAGLLHLHRPEAVVFFAYASAAVFAYFMTKLVERPFMALRDRIFPEARPATPLEQVIDDQAGAARGAA